MSSFGVLLTSRMMEESAILLCDCVEFLNLWFHQWLELKAAFPKLKIVGCSIPYHYQPMLYLVQMAFAGRWETY
jgi:hypothetical protein